MAQPNNEFAAFFPDPDSSSAVMLAANHIAAPIVRGTPMTSAEVMQGGGIRLVEFVFDRSPSMGMVAQLLMDGFNEDFVPAVKDAREDDLSALRIGGCSFSSGAPTPIWRKVVNGQETYYHPLEQLPPLTVAEYDVSKGWGTDFRDALKFASARAVLQATQITQATGMDVDIDIVAATDGADNGSDTTDDEIRQMIGGSDRSRVRYIAFYFDTDGGLKNPRAYFQSLGFDNEQIEVFLAKPGETAPERASRFRRFMKVLSRVSASKGTSATIAAQSVVDTDLI